MKHSSTETKPGIYCRYIHGNEPRLLII